MIGHIFNQQLRLDMESFSLSGPLEDTEGDATLTTVKTSHSVVGQCQQDRFIVTAAEGPSPPVICGENTGQHMYTSLTGQKTGI